MPVSLPLLALLAAFAPPLTMLLDVAAAAEPEHADTRPFECSNCDGWNAEQAPFPLAGNSWYVGPKGLASVLIDSGEGLILIDGGLPQSALPIAERIGQLGFEIGQVRWILNSHAHFDHAGGIAALARLSGAEVLASERGAEALRAGAVPADDPQAGYAPDNQFPPVANVRAVADGVPLTLGKLQITPIYTTGHTPGSTSWHWQSCDHQQHCLTLFYADSLTAVSSPEYRYSDHLNYLDQFRDSIARVAESRCDLIIAAHPGFVQLFERHREGKLIDAEGCRRYAEAAQAGLVRRVGQESSEPVAGE